MSSCLNFISRPEGSECGTRVLRDNHVTALFSLGTTSDHRTKVNKEREKGQIEQKKQRKGEDGSDTTKE